MKNRFEKYVVDNQLFAKNDKLLVAVSAGVDSVVLCQLLHLCNYRFSIVHCNFQLRGVDSEGDEAFVRALAESWNVPFYAKKFDTNQYVLDKKISIQLAARELRYAWFEELRQSMGYRYILTAHHASDSIETVFYNFAKGTGLVGLTGIKSKNGHIIRPLLWAKKEEILAFAQTENLQYREDISNESDKYARNFIRHHIIPDFKNINPSFETTAIENIKRLSETKDLFDYFLKIIKNETTKIVDNQLFINKNKLKTYPSVSTVLFEILKEFEFNASQITLILKEHESKTATVFYSPTHKLLIDRAFYVVAPLIQSIETENHFSISKNDSFIENEHFQLVLSRLDRINDLNPTDNTAILDADKLLFPLTLRRWREGDRFQPLGMKGKSQLLSDFFRLKKLSLFEKEKVWLLETADKNICWVVGLRIDERYKITEGSKSFFKIQLNPLS